MTLHILFSPPEFCEIGLTKSSMFNNSTPWRHFMSRKQRAIKNNKQANVFELTNALINNTKAWEEGPKRKTWSKHDLRTIRPLTVAQEDMFHAYINNYNICGYGTAGTGKTFLALYLALTEVFDEKSDVDHIIIVRSTVPTREIGHLPGTVGEKLAPYEEPYHDMLHELIGRASTYEDMKAAKLIEFKSTSFIRGSTWNNAVIIVDESQNMNFEEFSSVMTRVGESSKVMILGDTKQSDLTYSRKETSGFVNALKALELMPEFSLIRFMPQDIVRSPFVKSWILACEAIA